MNGSSPATTVVVVDNDTTIPAFACGTFPYERTVASDELLVANRSKANQLLHLIGTAYSNC